MTRVPGSPVDSTSCTPQTSDDSTAQNGPAGGFRVSEHLGMRWLYGRTNANSANASAQARQLANIAARLAALKRRIAARRQRRGMRGSGGDDDGFDDDFIDGTQSEHHRAEAGGMGGDSSGSGGQSHHDEHGSRSSDPAPKVEIKAQNIAPVPDPAPGVLATRITSEGRDTVDHGQLADDWLAAQLSQRDKLMADPNYRPDAEYLASLLDLLRAKHHIGPFKPQGMAAWCEKLKALPPAIPVNSSSVAPRATGTAGLAVPAGQRDLTDVERFNALLMLKLLEFDKTLLPAKADRAINTVNTQYNATLARRSKR